MRRARQRRWLIAALCALGLGLLVVSGVRWGDSSLFPPRSDDTVAILVVSNGFHSGLIIPRRILGEIAGQDGFGALIGVTTRFGHYDWLEVGWGEERFYREVPSLRSMNWWLGLRALFAPGNRSVMHVVGIEGDPRGPMAGADLVRLVLSRAGFSRLAAQLDRTFARGPDGRPVDLGPGLYGPSLFFRAIGTFGLFNLCNHWTARLLDAAGVPMSPLAATLPRGLIWDLKLRSGRSLEPDALPVPVETQ